MNWSVKIVKAKHRMWTEEKGYEESWSELAYLDPVSNVCVPMLDRPLKAKDILQMEEWAVDATEGIVFIDGKTNKVGILAR